MAAAHSPDNAIEADPNLDETSESGMDDDTASSRYTASLTSSIENYPMENGRRYHAFKNGTYVMPNDESELDRLDLTHNMLKISMNMRLFDATFSKAPKNILDIGTGTGMWAIEMADEYPEAEIVGTDLSPTQPSWVPGNVRFEIDDAEETWAFRYQFDFVHARYLAAAIKDWPNLVKQAFDGLTPGGTAEFQDFYLDYYSEDGSLKPEQHISKWITELLHASRAFGREPSPGPKLEAYMKEAGFENVTVHKYRLPIGPWPKDSHLKTVGSWNLVQIEAGLEAFSLRLFTQLLGWTTEDVQTLLTNVRKDLRNPKIHAQFDFYTVHGTKPTGV